MPIYRLPSPRNNITSGDSSGNTIHGDSSGVQTTTTEHQTTQRSAQIVSNTTDVGRSKSLPDYNRVMGDKRNGRRLMNGSANGADSAETLIEREIREQMEKEAEVAALHSPRSSALLLPDSRPEPFGIDTTTIHHLAFTNGSDTAYKTNDVGGPTNAVRLRLKPNENALNFCVPPGGVLPSTSVRRNPSAYGQKLSGATSDAKSNVSTPKQLRGVSLYHEAATDFTAVGSNQGLSKSMEALVLEKNTKTSTASNQSTFPQQHSREIPPPPPSHPPPPPPISSKHWQGSHSVSNNNASTINNFVAKNSINSASSISASSRLQNEEYSRIQRETKSLNNLEASSARSSSAVSEVRLIEKDDEFDDDGEFRLHSFVPQSETPIEKEIRLLRQREGSLRRARGFSLQLPPDDDRRNEIIEIPYVPVRGALSGLFDGNGEIGSEAVASDPSMRRLASSRLRHEMLAERERELDLRRQGKISTISEERIDLQPVMRSVHVAHPSTMSSANTSTENVGRLASNYQFNSLPKGTSSNHVSSSSTSYSRNNSNQNNNNIMSTAFTSDGKFPTAPRLTSQLPSPQPYDRPALPKTDPPGFSTTNRLVTPSDSQTQRSSVVVTKSSYGVTSSKTSVDRPSWRTSAEQIIEEEMKEMKRREEELAQERRLATASLMNTT